MKRILLLFLVVVTQSCGPSEQELSNEVEHLLCLDIPKDAEYVSHDYSNEWWTDYGLIVKYDLSGSASKKEFIDLLLNNDCDSISHPTCGCWDITDEDFEFTASDSISDTGKFAKATFNRSDNILDVEVIRWK